MMRRMMVRMRMKKKEKEKKQDKLTLSFKHARVTSAAPSSLQFPPRFQGLI